MTFSDIVSSQPFPELPICIERDAFSMDHIYNEYTIRMNVQEKKRPAENTKSVELNIVKN